MSMGIHTKVVMGFEMRIWEEEVEDRVLSIKPTTIFLSVKDDRRQGFNGSPVWDKGTPFARGPKKELRSDALGRKAILGRLGDGGDFSLEANWGVALWKKCGGQKMMRRNRGSLVVVGPFI